MPKNIAIIWDFDGTLTPTDSTSETIRFLSEENPAKFWENIKKLQHRKRKPKWEHILASDAPIWMFSLSRLASTRNIPLKMEFFKKFIVKKIDLFPGVIAFLNKIKRLSDLKRFKKIDLCIHHFIISAGLKELIEECFPKNLITWTFGCRYEVIYEDENEGQKLINVPVFCMDETVKTRSLFEIQKGTFQNPEQLLSKKITDDKQWSPFENMIYIGDGPTDIPSLSLVRSRRGAGIVVFNQNDNHQEKVKKLKEMISDGRADLVTPADYSTSSDLFNFIKTRCYQILQRYEAQDINSVK